MGERGYDTAANDVWALGVIFTSMVSGHNPWRRAVMADDCFRSYIRNPDFFRLMLPISPAADDILRGVFAPSEIRLSLSQFREKITKADTFFLDDDEIAGASKFVQLAAASYLCDISTQESSSSSFGAMLDLDIADAARRLAIEGRSKSSASSAEVDPRPSQGEHREAELQVNGIRTESRKRAVPPPPPPQRMPSFKELMHPSSPTSHSGTPSKKRSWRSHSPSGMFKRLMDRIIM